MNDPSDTILELDVEWGDMTKESSKPAEPGTPAAAKPPPRPINKPEAKPPLPRPIAAEPKPVAPAKPPALPRPAATAPLSRAELSPLAAPPATSKRTETLAAPPPSRLQAPAAPPEASVPRALGDAAPAPIPRAPATLADALAHVAPALPSALTATSSSAVTPPVPGARDQNTRNDATSFTGLRDAPSTGNLSQPSHSFARTDRGSATRRLSGASDGLRISSAVRLKTSVCAFWLGPRCFGLEVDLVSEVVRVDAVVPVPLAPAALVGLFNLRGLPVPLVDLAAVLELSEVGAPRENEKGLSALLLRSGRLVAAALIDRMEVVLSADRPLYTAEGGTDSPVVKGFVEVEERSGLVVTVLDSASVVRRLEQLKSV
jgi:chemotaxis signal transduction protein